MKLSAPSSRASLRATWWSAAIYQNVSEFFARCALPSVSLLLGLPLCECYNFVTQCPKWTYMAIYHSTRQFMSGLQFIYLWNGTMDLIGRPELCLSSIQMLLVICCISYEWVYMGNLPVCSRIEWCHQGRLVKGICPSLFVEQTQQDQSKNSSLICWPHVVKPAPQFFCHSKGWAAKKNKTYIVL